MVARVASLPYLMLELARRLDRKFAAASIEQARKAILVNQRRREELEDDSLHWFGELVTETLPEAKAG